MNKHTAFLLLRWCACAMLLAALACGQTLTTGDVVGVVTDTTGAVVPGATVTIKATESNETRTATTSDRGQYRFAQMSAGEYILSASTPGLKSNSMRFTVLVGQEQAMNIVMNPQGTTTTVEVNAETSVVQTENANLATSYNTNQVVDLPMAGGDLTTLAMTVPGVRVNTQGGSGNMNANGIPGSSILFTLNGFDVMDPYNNLNNSGASNNLLGQNEVSEAAVVLNAYSAQYGRMAGGQENLIGKSGSNQFHGNLLYNYNSQAFNAKDYFVTLTGARKTRSDANEFAAGGGGPIIKNKLFFFVDGEGLRYVLPAQIQVAMPSPQFQAYTLAHAPAAALPFYQDAFKLYNASPGYSTAVAMTNGTGPLQDSAGKLGCASRGTFAGTPTGTAGQTFGVNVPCAVAFTASNNQLNTESLFISRVDYNINDKQKIYFRYEYDWGVQATATSPIAPEFSSVSTQPQDTGTLNYTYVITPNLVNSFIGGASWYTAIFGVANFAKANSEMPEQFVISDGGGNPGNGAGNPGFATVGATIPNGRNVGQLQLIDDLSWTRGAHTLKFGMNYRFNKVTATNLSANTVEGTYTFNDLTDLATGQVNSTGQSSSFSQAFSGLAAAHIRVYSVNFYVQDEWAVRKNLKLTYGIRFERDGDPRCLDNCFARLNTQFGTAGYQGGASIPYNATIQTGLGTAYKNLESIIPEPRFGFVWSPKGSGPHAPVIRGGIGLFASLFAASVANNIDTNSPLYYKPSVTFGEVGPVSDSNSSLAAAQGAYNALESGFKQGFTMAQIQSALGKIKFTPPNYYSPPNNYSAPKVLEWSFEVEEPLSTHDVLALTYTGNHGYSEQLTNLDVNGFIGATSKYITTGFAGLPLTAPDPRFLTVTNAVTSGVSNYDALTVQVRHSFSHGFQGQFGYVWSHALGDVNIYNPFAVSSGYGSLAFDTRHQLTSDVVWTEPYKFSNKIVNAVAGGWVLGGKMFFQTGAPFSVTDSSLPAQINSAGGIGTNPIADLVNSSYNNISCGQANVQAPGNVSCFGSAPTTVFATKAQQLDFGNISPDSFRGPRYFDIDTQVTKNFRIRERATFGLGAQFFNILNHPNFKNPSGTVTSSALGYSTATVVPPTSIYGSFQSGTVSGRVMVLVGKFTF
jgi:outer membrane receptor for ferrienterochelin and colicin